MPDYGAMLGNVKPHVRANAIYIATKYNLKVIGGWRSTGSVPNSDHPRGLAVDFMCDIPTGNRIVADFQANWNAYNTKYVIHNRRFYPSPTRSEPYVGPNPHTDHVHVSYVDNPTGPGSLPGSGGSGSAPTSDAPRYDQWIDENGDPNWEIIFEDVGVPGFFIDILRPFFGIFTVGFHVIRFIQFIGDPTNWVRVGLALFGGFLLLFGLWAMIKRRNVITIDAAKALKNAS